MIRRADPARLEAVRAAAAALCAEAGARPDWHGADSANPLAWMELGAGPPIVLLHGGSGGAANWFGVVLDLAARRRVLAPDLPGFGESPAVRLQPPLGLQAARKVLEWLDATGVGGSDLVGTSFGGLVALRLMQLAPQRFRRAVLLAPAGMHHSLPLIVRAACATRLARSAAGPNPRSTRALLRHVLTSRPLPPAVEAALVEYLTTVAAVQEPGYLAAALRHFAGWRGQNEVLADDELASIRTPALVVWGSRDRLLPPAHARRARRMPNADVVTLDGAGHSANWEAPRAVLDRIERFLDRVPDRG